MSSFLSGALQLFVIIFNMILVNNYVLVKFYGICPFLGVSKKLDSAVGMSWAVVFVMVLATAVTFPIQYFILDQFDLGYLQTIVFILVIAVLVQFIEIFLKKYMISLYDSLGVYLPLITTNCCVLAVTILVVTDYGGAVNIAATGFGRRPRFCGFGARNRLRLGICDEHRVRVRLRPRLHAGNGDVQRRAQAHRELPAPEGVRGPADYVDRCGDYKPVLLRFRRYGRGHDGQLCQRAEYRL